MCRTLKMLSSNHSDKPVLSTTLQTSFSHTRYDPMVNISIWTPTNLGHNSNHWNDADPNSLLVCTEHALFAPYSSPTEVLVKKWYRVILVRTYAEHETKVGHDEMESYIDSVEWLEVCDPETIEDVDRILASLAYPNLSSQLRVWIGREFDPCGGSP